MNDCMCIHSSKSSNKVHKVLMYFGHWAPKKPNYVSPVKEIEELANPEELKPMDMGL